MDLLTRLLERFAKYDELLNIMRGATYSLGEASCDAVTVRLAS